MPSYQIYLPGIRGADPRHLIDAGLGDLLDPKITVESVEGQGPDGARGAVFFWTNPEHPEFSPTAGFHPDQQNWSPCKPRDELPAGRYWMGKERDCPVEPESIIRSGPLIGRCVELCDGQQWMIPAAPLIPCKVGLDNRGMPTRLVPSKYQAYCDQVIVYFNKFLAHRAEVEASGIIPDVSLGPAWPFCVTTLALNYRVNADIVDWLGLLDEPRMILLIFQTFEGPMLLLIDSQKKTAEISTPATELSSLGLAD